MSGIRSAVEELITALDAVVSAEIRGNRDYDMRSYAQRRAERERGPAVDSGRFRAQHEGSTMARRERISSGKRALVLIS